METKRVTLTQLADHLEKGDCIHETFDFSTFNTGCDSHNKIPHCRTNGCAIGEMPALDKDWSFSSGGESLYKGIPFDKKTLMAYFNLDIYEIEHLFYPGYQDIEAYGGIGLSEYATKAQVIHNIREFVRITGKN